MHERPSEPNPDRLAAENERLRRSVEELSLLNDLAVAIGASNDPRTIVETIVKRARKSLACEQGDIVLISDLEALSAETLIRAEDSQVERDTIHMNQHLLGWMMQHKQPIILNDPAGDPRFKGAVWDEEARSILSVPLLIRSRLIGLLSVYNKYGAPGRFTEHDQRLLAIIAAQSAQVLENARLLEEEKQLQGMREELRLAKEIQSSLFPQTLPRIEGYDIAGASWPAQTVGGDYYDVMAIDAHRVGLCVGDASGKGLPASLLMANVQATLRSIAPWSATCGECLDRINRLVCDRTRRGSFVTMVYAVLDPHAHTVSYANAGHNRPLICRADGRIEALDRAGAMLGFTPDLNFPDTTATMEPGDTLFLFSDGLPEAWNDAHEQFGDERIASLLADMRQQPADAIIAALREAIATHAGGAAQSDDVTLLVAKRR